MENIGYDILYSDDFNLIAEDFCLYINPYAENKIKPMLAKSFFDLGVSICQFKGNKIKQLKKRAEIIGVDFNIGERGGDNSP